MEKNDDLLDLPGEPGEWRPDVERGLARFRQRRKNARVRARRWLWGGGVALATSLCVMAIPVTRVFASRCVGACVAEGNEIGFLLRSAISPGGATVIPVNGAMAPDFSAVDSAGALLRLSDFKGRVTVLNFWASWCVPCKEETPWFVEFQRKYGSDGLVVIGVSLDDDGWKSVRPFITGMGVNYRTVLGSEQITRLFGGVEALPVTVTIDRSGRIAAMHTGLIGHDEFEAEIRAMLSL